MYMCTCMYVYMYVKTYVHVYMYVNVCTIHPANTERSEARGRRTEGIGKPGDQNCKKLRKKFEVVRQKRKNTEKKFLVLPQEKKKKNCGKFVLYHLGHTSVKKNDTVPNDKVQIFFSIFCPPLRHRTPGGESTRPPKNTVLDPQNCKKPFSREIV